MNQPSAPSSPSFSAASIALSSTRVTAFLFAFLFIITHKTAKRFHPGGNSKKSPPIRGGDACLLLSCLGNGVDGCEVYVVREVFDVVAGHCRVGARFQSNSDITLSLSAPSYPARITART